MSLILLIVGIIFLALGVVALIVTGFLGYVVYVPLLAIGAICLFIRWKIS